jgi:hypothetical protein
MPGLLSSHLLFAGEAAVLPSWDDARDQDPAIWALVTLHLTSTLLLNVPAPAAPICKSAVQLLSGVVGV